MVMAGVSSYAQTQNGAYSGFTPYSIYGIGDVKNFGTAYNRSMAGVGVASRNNRYINTMNPAALTARDSLAFMADMSLQSDNSIFRQGSMRSGNNNLNINDITLSFPIFSKASAMAFGIAPYSTTGYSYATTNAAFLTKDGEYDKVLSDSQSINYTASGKGCIYQLYAAAAATLWNRLSLGAELIEYFGQTEKYSNVIFGSTAYYNIKNGSEFNITGTAGKFGLQYQQPMGSSSLTFGASYKTRARMKGYAGSYRTIENSSTGDSHSIMSMNDTLSKKNIYFGDEIAVGLSYVNNNRWRFEVDYLTSGWGNSNLDSQYGFAVKGTSQFSASRSQSVRAGFEIVPNINDIRYFYRTIAYRTGIYWDRSYYQLDGNNIDAYGITIGGTIPVYRWYNGITIAMDLGRRASLANNMIRETYVNFSIGFNVFDIWFRKPEYD